jgi:phosphatidylethanolamine-binding protein (PEBP) family uncharacterized protein
VGVTVSFSTRVSPSENESKDGCLTSGSMDDIIPYKAPGPPPKTGKHRYVFLAFAPANGTKDALKLTKPDNRQHWGTGKDRHGVRDWAAENGLVPVGESSTAFPKPSDFGESS